MNVNLQIDPIRAFQDNYIWALHDSSRCVLVDPGQAPPVLAYLHQRKLRPVAIVLTHHHNDHIGGVDAIIEQYPVPVWGPDDARMPVATHAVAEGDTVSVPALGLAFGVLEIPAHTRSHIAFHGHGLLFPGDTLFSVGCGRLFEGTAEQMQASLDKLLQLPDDTRFYCGHEYTLANCRFALAVEPDNPALHERIREVQALRAADLSTLPATLAQERATNPFLRTRKPVVIAAAQQRGHLSDPHPAAVLGVLRRWKDEFV